MTRAGLLPTILAAAVTVSPVLAQEEPLVRFGVIADPQYAPVPPRGTRYYANTLWKLSEAVEALNDEELDFVVTLGDIIDRHAESYTHILPIYQKLEHDNWFVLGNHEFAVAADYLLAVPNFLAMDERYYDREVNGVRFIALDSTDSSTYAHPEGTPEYDAAQAVYTALVASGAVQAKTWNSALSEQQLVWLRQRLDAAQAAGEPVILFAHHPIYPENEHNLWNAEEVVALLADYDNIVAYMNGHNHAGNYGVFDGTHYVTLEGMVESPAETAYAIVEVYPDRLVIEGVGDATDRDLAVPAGAETAGADTAN